MRSISWLVQPAPDRLIRVQILVAPFIFLFLRIFSFNLIAKTKILHFSLFFPYLHEIHRSICFPRLFCFQFHQQPFHLKLPCQLKIVHTYPQPSDDSSRSSPGVFRADRSWVCNDRSVTPLCGPSLARSGSRGFKNSWNVKKPH